VFDDGDLVTQLAVKLLVAGHVDEQVAEVPRDLHRLDDVAADDGVILQPEVEVDGDKRRLLVGLVQALSQAQHEVVRVFESLVERGHVAVFLEAPQTAGGAPEQHVALERGAQVLLAGVGVARDDLQAAE
jgi:hypothetical protein